MPTEGYGKGRINKSKTNAIWWIRRNTQVKNHCPLGDKDKKVYTG